MTLKSRFVSVRGDGLNEEERLDPQDDEGYGRYFFPGPVHGNTLKPEALG